MPDLNTEFSMETLGSAIRSKRTDRGWSIDELSSKANLSRRTIMKIEKGDTSATFANVLVLMDISELSLRLIDLSLFVRPHNQIKVHRCKSHYARPYSYTLKHEEGRWIFLMPLRKNEAERCHIAGTISVQGYCLGDLSEASDVISDIMTTVSRRRSYPALFGRTSS